MKLSELIKEMQKILEDQGDMDVTHWLMAEGPPQKVDPIIKAWEEKRSGSHLHEEIDSQQPTTESTTKK
jgi:hypothetical protein